MKLFRQVQEFVPATRKVVPTYDNLVPLTGEGVPTAWDVVTSMGKVISVLTPP